jgi:hypothetical protein
MHQRFQLSRIIMMTAATIIEAAHNKDAAMPIGGIKHTRNKMRAARGDAMSSSISAASFKITKVSIALIQNANIPIIIINTVVMMFVFNVFY